ncbi:MAG: Gfo/Idh/MocA family oxidoreductase [Enterobacteriaceae bacterium]
MKGYTGFVICEKPLATQGDRWREACSGLAQIRGFALDLVERYSEVTRRLKEKVHQQNWSLVRAHFYWGKDRINDYRPTCGVSSEIIHALDLINWICPHSEGIKLEQVLGARSDFSISGPAVLDSVLLTATLGEVPVTGYSSFVNVQRQRNVDLSFVDKAGTIIHAHLIYDTPHWDHDHLRIWQRDKNGADLVILEHSINRYQAGLETVYKLSLLCEDVLRFMIFNTSPAQSFPSLDVAIYLQELLDDINEKVVTTYT